MRQSGQLVVLGVIQEQHADRCRLFAQWQGFDWPILHDPINQVAPRAVPIVVAIDEAGVVVDPNLSTDKLDEFLGRPPVAATPQLDSATQQPRFVPELRSAQYANLLDQRAQQTGAASDWLAAGDHSLLWGDTDKETAAIDRYRKCVAVDPHFAPGWFRLGVAHRARYDSTGRLRGDFASAAAAWDRALEIDPNHYIYRRRIQQYGPRLSKPYPFYDWIEQARAEIIARNQVPIPLIVEPVGAEIASPSNEVQSIPDSSQAPDPQGRITRDAGTFVEASVVVVPGRIKPGEAVRVHLTFQPNHQSHWNNEAEPLRIWLDIPDRWEVQRSLIELPQPTEAESSEVRSIDFELRTPHASSDRMIDAYALYYVCEEQGGQCLFRRLDFQIPIRFGE